MSSHSTSLEPKSQLTINLALRRKHKKKEKIPNRRVGECKKKKKENSRSRIVRKQKKYVERSLDQTISEQYRFVTK